MYGAEVYVTQNKGEVVKFILAELFLYSGFGSKAPRTAMKSFSAAFILIQHWPGLATDKWWQVSLFFVPLWRSGKDHKWHLLCSAASHLLCLCPVSHCHDDRSLETATWQSSLPSFLFRNRSKGQMCPTPWVAHARCEFTIIYLCLTFTFYQTFSSYQYGKHERNPRSD